VHRSASPRASPALLRRATTTPSTGRRRADRTAAGRGRWAAALRRHRRLLVPRWSTATPPCTEGFPCGGPVWVVPPPGAVHSLLAEGKANRGGSRCSRATGMVPGHQHPASALPAAWPRPRAGRPRARCWSPASLIWRLQGSNSGCSRHVTAQSLHLHSSAAAARRPPPDRPGGTDMAGPATPTGRREGGRR
jgi:hypothetical protein